MKPLAHDSDCMQSVDDQDRGLPSNHECVQMYFWVQDADHRASSHSDSTDIIITGQFISPPQVIPAANDNDFTKVRFLEMDVPWTHDPDQNPILAHEIEYDSTVMRDSAIGITGQIISPPSLSNPESPRRPDSHSRTRRSGSPQLPRIPIWLSRCPRTRTNISSPSKWTTVRTSPLLVLEACVSLL